MFTINELSPRKDFVNVKLCKNILISNDIPTDICNKVAAVVSVTRTFCVFAS